MKKIATDTATLCVFDLAKLKYRLHDPADWWTTSDTELDEMNKGNVTFLRLGTDGIYTILIEDNLLQPSIQANLGIESGHVFVGAAEEVTGGGLEPEGLRGFFITFAPGNYLLSAKREGDVIKFSFALGDSGINQFQEPLNL